MPRERISIPVGDGESVSSVLEFPLENVSGEGIAVILAHGAGNDMDHPLIVTMSEGLARAGCVTLRFNFLYREKGRRAPDPQETLARTWLAVYRFLLTDRRCPSGGIVAAGKSMGGRVASEMVADGVLPVSRLIFLGYPLHRPGKKQELRDAHLHGIRIPMLFFAGTRDPLCDLTRLGEVISQLSAPADLEVIEGGDHSFRLRKGAPITQQDVYAAILHATLKWLEKT